MMACTDCGHIFDESEAQAWHERHGLDCPPYEQFSGCPNCGGYYEEAYKCEVCGDYFAFKDLHGGSCDNCIEEHKAYKDCKSVFEGEQTDVKIDVLIADMLGAEIINQILRADMDQNRADMDCTKAIDLDREWFGEALAAMYEKEDE